MLDEGFLDEIRAIPWFSRCGQRITANVPMPVTTVTSWEAAVVALATPAWDNALLEARNELTVFLHKNHRSGYQAWNEKTAVAKLGCVLPLTENVWVPFSQSHGLPIQFVHSVQWNVLAAIMEHEYRGIVGLPSFFTHLLTLFKAGHCPCGWSGAEYPLGEVCVL